MSIAAIEKKNKMTHPTPLRFCSFGGYHRFSARWWANIVEYLSGVDFTSTMHLWEYKNSTRSHINFGIPGWCRDVHTYWHRARYGWAPQDVWNLDHYLNRVMSDTLEHLANTTHGAPYGYPKSRGAAIKSTEPERETDHEQWERDLKEWAAAFRGMHEWEEHEEMEEWNKNLSAAQLIKEEQKRMRRVEKALKQLAPWWSGLWD